MHYKQRSIAVCLLIFLLMISLFAAPKVRAESSAISEDELIGVWRYEQEVFAVWGSTSYSITLNIKKGNVIERTFETGSGESNYQPGTYYLWNGRLYIQLDSEENPRVYSIYRDKDELFLIPEKQKDTPYYRVTQEGSVAEARGAVFRNARWGDSKMCVKAYEEAIPYKELLDNAVSFDGSFLGRGIFLTYDFNDMDQMYMCTFNEEAERDSSTTADSIIFYNNVKQFCEDTYGITWPEQELVFTEGNEALAKGLSDEEALEKGYIEYRVSSVTERGENISVSLSKGLDSGPYVFFLLRHDDVFTDEELKESRAGNAGYTQIFDENLETASITREEEPEPSPAPASEEETAAVPFRYIYGTAYPVPYSIAPEISYRTYTEGISMEDYSSSVYGCRTQEDAKALYETYVEYLKQVLPKSNDFTSDETHSIGSIFLEEESDSPSIILFYTTEASDPHGSQNPDSQSYLVCLQIYKDPENSAVVKDDTNVSEDKGISEESTYSKDTIGEGTTENVASSTEQAPPESMSEGDRQAVEQAKLYLEISAFSYNGLIDQLEFEGYTYSQAAYAAEACGADWSEQALNKAKSYLDISAFSYQGLIDQLEFDQFTHEQAVYGADHCGADWMEQAAKKGASYLEFSSFSRDGLIDQLEFEGFTYDEAVYAANRNGL